MHGGKAPAGRFGRLCAALLRAAGWKVVVRWPPVPKVLLIVYPHTSNWDFVVGILARFAAELPARWVGKDTLFRWPFGGLFRALGGLPVNRRQSSGFVAQMQREFARSGQLFLAIAPEGTRRKTDHWKSGFYRAARAANVPLGLVFIDYARREVGVDIYLDLSGDEPADLARIRAAYAGKRGRRVELQGEIRFKDGTPPRIG